MVAAAVDDSGSLSFGRHTISVLPHTVALLRKSCIMGRGHTNFMREEFSAWRGQACVNVRRNGWAVREQYKGLECQNNTGREEKGAYKGNKAASNTNLYFLGAFLWGSDYVELSCSGQKERRQEGLSNINTCSGIARTPIQITSYFQEIIIVPRKLKALSNLLGLVLTGAAVTR